MVSSSFLSGQSAKATNLSSSKEAPFGLVLKGCGVRVRQELSVSPRHQHRWSDQVDFDALSIIPALFEIFRKDREQAYRIVFRTCKQFTTRCQRKIERICTCFPCSRMPSSFLFISMSVCSIISHDEAVAVFHIVTSAALLGSCHIYPSRHLLLALGISVLRSSSSFSRPLILAFAISFLSRTTVSTLL